MPSTRTYFAPAPESLHVLPPLKGEKGNGEITAGIETEKSPLELAWDRIKELEAELAATKLDLKKAKLDAEKAEAVAYTDKLTGLPNRGAFDRDLIVGISRFLHAEHHDPLVVAFIDLDGLKVANDVHGHTVGDAMLKNFAHKAKGPQGHLREGDMLYRQGGDEFLMIGETHVPEQLKQKMKKFQNECDKRAFSPADQTCFSIGFSVLDSKFLATHYPNTPRRAVKAEDIAQKLVEQADAAMYHNKRKERNVVRGQQNAAVATSIIVSEPSNTM